MRYVTGPVAELAGGKKISKIGLGTWQFGSKEWGYGQDYAEKEAPRLVGRALELGITLIDTAEIYAFGRSERIVGEALRAAGPAAEGAFVATKILPVLPVAPMVEQRGVASARRLGVRRIDLYQVHQPNPLIKDGTTMAGMRGLREVGLVEAVGVSNYSLARWQDAEAALGAPVLSNQVEYSLLRRSPDEALIPYAERAARLVIAYSPLAQGLLSGRYDVTNRPEAGIVRTRSPLFLTENLARLTPLLDVLREVAAAHDATCAQIALAWAIHRPCVVAIPGASSVAQLEANAAAAEIDLTDDQYTALTDAATKFVPLTGASAWAAVAAERLPFRIR
ncbi:aldo/keto reductase [Frankia sp. CNm7]|uniref:Aldo/keto reductase n=1 Tax=Frankia nepalensis TaxID=1836974 RepID=A0A937URP5_9ACTN|nr:aldo/keto reductase [Frankia nepalensis]MBL7496470.1 aldo/keto reductase [Frankia nepalensis]MBL7510793.1 aldo/keto reductase [Frankia nepalensis]MBL7521897.1 aldo/keto reductase [Frankia nepalensis]MBL7631592.1 aldo/keto reductase [Frankia nepalensis]